MSEHGLPELCRYGDWASSRPANHPARAGLEAARAAYNAERDAYLAKEVAENEAQ